MRNSQNYEIVLCGACEGKGYKIHSELVNYHKGEYEDTKEDCKTCEGSGRLWKEFVTTYSPYK